MQTLLPWALLILLASCGGGPAREAEKPPTKAATVVPSPTAATDVEAREPLPRSIESVSLTMSRSEVEAKLGTLTCHDNPAGFVVCSGNKAPKGEAMSIEVYLHHDHVVSISYEIPPPADAFSYLEAATRRYGKPALNGHTEVDKDERLHEIYGWKDEESLYSIRFVWSEDAGGRRNLAATIITLWDRKSYDQWEQDPERPRGGKPKEPVEPPRSTPTAQELPELT